MSALAPESPTPEPLFLSPLPTLRRDAPIAALANGQCSRPTTQDARITLVTRLSRGVEVLQTVPPRRTFLCAKRNVAATWRYRADDHYNSHHLFGIQIEPFEPALAEADRLTFALRVNAVVSKKDRRRKVQEARRGSRRAEGFPEGRYALRRDGVAIEAGAAWLKSQGAKSGFDVEAVDACAYRKVSLPRKITLGVLT